MPASLENKQIGQLALAIAKPIYACENKHIGLLALTIAKSKYACDGPLALTISEVKSACDGPLALTTAKSIYQDAILHASLELNIHMKEIEGACCTEKPLAIPT